MMQDAIAAAVEMQKGENLKQYKTYELMRELINRGETEIMNEFLLQIPEKQKKI